MSNILFIFSAFILLFSIVVFIFITPKIKLSEIHHKDYIENLINSSSINFRDNFDVYLVSLPKDQERRDNLGVVPDYVFSVDGSTLDKNELENNGTIVKDCTLRKGEIGCYMSHIELLKRSLTSSKKYVLILEDDAKIEPDTFAKISEVLETSPPDYDMLFLGHNYYEDYYTFKKINYMHGAQAYLVNKDNITLEKINTLYPIEKPYDVILPVKFKTYVVVPKIIELGKFGGHSNTQGIN